MLKKIIFFFMLCFAFGSLSSQTTDLFYQYEIPTYEYNLQYFYGQDFLNYFKRNTLESQRQFTRMEFDLGYEQFRFSQSPMTTTEAYSMANINYNSTTDKTPANKVEDETTTSLLLMSGCRNWYLNDSRGMFVFLDPAVMYLNDFSNSFYIQAMDAAVGAGFGRVISVRNVAQAYKIVKELELQDSDSLILQIAETLEKNNNGFFAGQYLNDSEIEFYKELAALTGKPAQAMKIQQIINSPFYQTSQRFVGWEIKVGLNNGLYNIGAYTSGYYGKTEEYYYGLDLVAGFRYTLPITFNHQLSTSISYATPLNNEDYELGKNARADKFNLGASFGIDHSFFWASNFSFNYSQAYPDVGDALTNIRIMLETDYVLLNSFSVYGAFDYNKYQFYEENVIGIATITMPKTKQESFNIHIGFRYYIL